MQEKQFSLESVVPQHMSQNTSRVKLFNRCCLTICFYTLSVNICSQYKRVTSKQADEAPSCTAENVRIVTCFFVVVVFTVYSPFGFCLCAQKLNRLRNERLILTSAAVQGSGPSGVNM